MKRDLVKVPANSQPEPPREEPVAQVGGNAVIPPEAKGILGELVPSDRQIMCTWDPTTEHGAWLYQKCEEDQDDRLRKIIGTEIVLRDFMTKKIPDYLDKETGEVRPILRVVLVTIDDEVYGCSAGGIAESLHRLCIRYGRTRWPEGLRVRVEQKPLEDKKVRMILLEQFPNYDRKGKK